MSSRTLISHDRLFEVIGAEGELLARSATGADPAFDVPGCPGLTLGETVRHVGSLYRMVLSWLRAGDRPTTWQREPDEGQSAIEFMLTGSRAMLAELARRDPEDTAPTWWPDHSTYGFWYRRLAHETTVHRVDVQGAAGVPLDPVPDDVALDGVDEILSLWYDHRLTVLGVSGTRHGWVKVRTGGREWVARVTPEGTSSWRAEGGEPVDGTVFGDPMSMYLWLWGRLPPHAVTRDGSEDAVAQMWALLRLATR